MHAKIKYKLSSFPGGFSVPQKCLPFEMVELFLMNKLEHKQNKFDVQDIRLFLTTYCI